MTLADLQAAKNSINETIEEKLTELEAAINELWDARPEAVDADDEDAQERIDNQIAALEEEQEAWEAETV